MKNQTTKHTNGHKDKKCAKKWVETTNNFINRQDGSNEVVNKNTTKQKLNV